MNKFIFLILFSFLSLANAEELNKKTTPLDDAYLLAIKEQDKQSNFYNLFLSSDLYIPTHKKPKSDRSYRAVEGESVAPVFSESNGIPYFMIFDSKERLGNWAQREVGFVAMPGHAVVEMMSADISWVLNAGTDYVKVFSSDEIKWLKKEVDTLNGRREMISKSTNILIGAPKIVPDGLMESVTGILVRNKEVKRAFLGQVYYVGKSEKPNLILVLETDAEHKNLSNAIRKDVASAARGYIGESDFIDITFTNESGVADGIVEKIKPFYTR